MPAKTADDQPGVQRGGRGQAGVSAQQRVDRGRDHLRLAHATADRGRERNDTRPEHLGAPPADQQGAGQHGGQDQRGRVQAEQQAEPARIDAVDRDEDLGRPVDESRQGTAGDPEPRAVRP